MVKIVHLTSAHPRYDTRIFVKECISLSKIENYEVYLIVADGLGNEIKEGVHFYDVGKSNGRLDRIFKTTKKIFSMAIELNANIYHLHDPELLPIGLKLKKRGEQVIFDIHENISKQIKSKDYINPFIRWSLSFIYAQYEKKVLKRMDRLILAEDSYTEYYSKISNKITVILNMPDVNMLKEFQVENRDKNGLFYIGGISNLRGLDVTIEAIKLLKDKIPDIYMHYVGNTYDNILDTIDIEVIENHIKFYGAMPLLEGLKLSKNAKIGLSILKPIENYTTSYSTKIFEYMALELPVITSNFELYKNVVEKYNCGLCVDPLNVNEIADGIKYIIENPKIAKEMGKNGKKIVFEKFNWKNEERKLHNLYKEVSKCI